MTARAAIRDDSAQGIPTTHIHFGRSLALDPTFADIKQRLRRDMPRFDFNRVMARPDQWVISVICGQQVSGFAVFSNELKPVLIMYYACDPTTSCALMGTINQWRKV